MIMVQPKTQMTTIFFDKWISHFMLLFKILEVIYAQPIVIFSFWMVTTSVGQIKYFFRFQLSTNLLSIGFGYYYLIYFLTCNIL
jgi:hypothetical protein